MNSSSALRARLEAALPGLLFVFLFGLSGAAGLWKHREVQSDAQAQVEFSTQRISAEVSRRFTQVVYGLYGARGVYAASQSVNRAAFRAYVESRDLPKEFPGVHGFGFIQRVLRPDLDAFLRAERADGAPQFTLRQLSDTAQQDLLIIKFIEPAATNQGAMGLDIGSEPLRRSAAQRAIDSGQATMTAPITLVQDEHKTPGVLLFVPVYARGSHPTTMAERRAALVGMLYAPLVINELLRDIPEIAAGLMDIEVFDSTPGAPATLIYDPDDDPDKHGAKPEDLVAPDTDHLLSTSQSMSLMGRELSVRVNSEPKFDATLDRRSPWRIAVGGAVLAALLALYLRGRLRQIVAVNTLVERRTSELDRERLRLKALLETATDGIHILDEAGLLLEANPAFLQMLGLDASAVGKLRVTDWDPAVDDSGVLQVIDSLIKTQSSSVFESRSRHSNGSLIDVEISARGIEIGGRGLAYCASRDISERKRREEQVKEADALLRTAIDTIDEAFVIYDPHDCLVLCNERYRQTYSESAHLMEPGVSFETLLRNGAKRGRYLDAVGREDEWVSERLAIHHACTGIPLLQNHDNGQKLRIVERKTADGYIVGFRVDVTELYQAKHAAEVAQELLQGKHDELERVAKYDTLTTLPNRALLADRLNQALSMSRRTDRPLGVAFIDLDGFKAVNDTYGHEAGDHLLITLAERMKGVLRDGDILARLGGDEFVAVLLDLADVDASAPMLNRLLDAAARPVQFGQARLQVSASLGVTFYPQAQGQEQELEPDQLLRQADQAMYQAKQAGKNRFCVFDAEQDRNVRARHESMQSIEHALSAGEFVLEYQPKVNLRSGAVLGVEALIRWLHPQRGRLPPADFLPMVEDHPLAVKLGQWVIESALAQIEGWQQDGLNIAVSVNIGVRHLMQADFVQRLREALDAHPRLKPDCLELELLEPGALKDLAYVSQVIQACRSLGVECTLDDFGSGQSSLTCLKRLPVKYLKIDQNFISDMLGSSDSLLILIGVLKLASAFDLKVIAEGVETAQHGFMLLELGCELAQGYGIARPMPPDELPAWVKRWKPDPIWSDVQLVSH